MRAHYSEKDGVGVKIASLSRSQSGAEPRIPAPTDTARRREDGVVGTATRNSIPAAFVDDAANANRAAVLQRHGCETVWNR